MLWEVRGQIYIFLGAIYGGLGAGALYSLCRLLRTPVSKFWADIIFAPAATGWLLMWFYMLCRLRFAPWALTGAAVGFALWHYGPERLTMYIFQKLYPARL
ncbi:MAG: hypothetical protein FWD16_06015 [Clostridia bacterium]|nr:hypothetical protein [Clostridia bacterium]